MTAEIIIILFAVVFIIMSILLFMGKATWLIAGYNTASQEEKDRFDVRKIGRAAAIICLVCAVMLLLMAYFGYKVDSGVISEDSMLVFGAVFAFVILATVFFSIKYMNKCIKK